MIIYNGNKYIIMYHFFFSFLLHPALVPVRNYSRYNCTSTHNIRENESKS